MRTATVLSALVAAGLTVGAAVAEAQTPSATIQATATVQPAITVTAGNDLVFGNVTPGVDKTVAITDPGAGTFTVAKGAGTGVTLSFSLPTDLDSGTDLLPIGSWTGGWNTSASPVGATTFTPSAAGENTAVDAATTLTVFVGATVSPAAAQTAGNYSGDVTMSVVYF
jgi:hypothetical protein